MTENEAKGWLIELKDCEETQEFYYADCIIETLDIAIKALEEIQQYRAIGTVKGYERAIESSIENYNLYREYKAKVQDFEAIGTVEEITNLIKFLSFDDDTSILEDLRMLVEYYAIGTVEEFKTLKEKNEPKKIDIWANGEEHCPFCDKNLTTFYGFANCFSCGQKIDWQ